jgi:hypothetical protein
VPNEARKWTAASLSAYDATVKTSAGSGKVVLAGSTRPLVCDGTNVINPITAVSELKQLEVATNSKGNVSRHIMALPNNTTSNGYWIPIAEFAPHATLSDGITLHLSVSGAINSRGAFGVHVTLTQDPSTGWGATTSSVKVVGGQNITTPYAPQFRVIAPSSGPGSVATLWMQTNETYASYVVHELTTAIYQPTSLLTYLTGQAWQLAEPTGVFEAKSYSGSFGGRKLANVVDTSDLSAPTILQPGEAAIVSWTSQTSKALNINCVNGGVFEIDVDTDMGGPDGAISLSPNNTSYSGQINEHIQRSVHNTSVTPTIQSGAVFQLAYGQKNSNAPMFASGRLHVGSTGASPNGLKRYVGVGKGIVAGNNETRRYASEWINNTTVWASLGTLSFSNSCSGVATIKRVS